MNVWRLALVALLAGSILCAAPVNQGVLRFPDTDGKTVVFVAAGDIWRVPASGGSATRLTTHEGLELFPKLSPDGRWVAFSGEYGGSRQVFVMPVEGGLPRQLTWYNDVGIMPPRGGWDHVVLGWTPDSRSILFRANRTPYGERVGRYYLVDLDGGLERALPIPEGGIAALSEDGGTLCFTPVSREFRTWKRYQGGRASDLWLWDLNQGTSRRLTRFPGTDQNPSWFGGKVVFASDRDLRLNLYLQDPRGGEAQALTHHKDFDVLWPSGHGGTVAYEGGGDIWLLDLSSRKSRRCDIRLEDDEPGWRTRRLDVHKNVVAGVPGNGALGAVLEARGDLFWVPADSAGQSLNLTRTPGIRERSPLLGPDGRTLFFFSDREGDYDIYAQELKAGATPRRVTRDGGSWKNGMVVSRDGGSLLLEDQAHRLRLLNARSGTEKVVVQSKRGGLDGYTFSPDGRWVVYSMSAANGLSQLWVYDVVKGLSQPLTDGTFRDYSPVFAPDGKALYFLSDRDFNLQFSAFEFNYLYVHPTRIFVLPLESGSGHPFLKPPAGMVPAEKVPGGENVEKARALSPLWDRAEARLLAIGQTSRDFGSLLALARGLVYEVDGSVCFLPYGEEEETVLATHARLVERDGAGEHVLIQQGGQWFLAACGQPVGEKTPRLKVQGLFMDWDPQQEWAQIFRDACRIIENWFYVPNLHGVDWKALKARYGSLAGRVRSRADLDFVLGELMSELNVGHAYVNWGDVPRVERVDTGLLGCEWVPDKANGRYRFSRILPGENWNGARRSPLTEPGSEVQEGELLLQVDGQDVTLSDNPYRFLVGTVGRWVSLRVAHEGRLKQARDVWVRPVASEVELRYLAWVREREALVDKLSHGRIGYMHLPNTAVEGNRELNRGLIHLHDREALIIDDRYNGGGFIPDRMIELLTRKPLAWWVRRGRDAMRTPGLTHPGPKAMLINGYSSSGGDALPYFFRKLGLGPLIGTRTWGGLVGLSGNPAFVDGGSLSVPTFGISSGQGDWIIEGEGVAPDIEVIDDPQRVARGEDPSLEEAVRILLQKLDDEPVATPRLPVPPDRSAWMEGKGR